MRKLALSISLVALSLACVLTACTRESPDPPVATLPISTATIMPTALFVYEENGDTLAFFPPKMVRVTVHDDAGTHTCQTDLPDNGNMWSGADVEHGFRDATVQGSLRSHASFLGTSASISSGGDTLVWRSACPGCALEPAPVQHFQTMMHGVLGNRRSLCP